MYSGVSPDHLAQPLTADETAELARLEQKVEIANQLTRLDNYLTRFCYRHYPRWLALNPILPSRYYSAWSIPVARWPWSPRPFLIWRPSLGLTERESGTLEYLGARQRRPAELARFDHDPDAVNGWIARYEREKASERRADLHPDIAADALKDFKAELRKKKAYLKRFEKEDPAVYRRHRDSLKKNAAAFKQHIEKDLARFEQEQVSVGDAPADVVEPVLDGEKLVWPEPAQIADDSGPLSFASGNSKDKTATPSADLEGYFTPRCTLDLCDKAARQVGLNQKAPPGTFMDARIHALSEALGDTSSLKATKGIMSLVRLALAQRYQCEYNVKYGPQHGKSTTKTGRNEQWDTFYSAAKTTLGKP